MADTQAAAAAHLSLTFDMRRPDWVEPSRKTLYDVAIAMCAWAEENGFESVTLAEHHLTEDHYISSPLIMGSAVAARTLRLAIRMIVLAPFYEPLRLVEDLRMLHVMSGGRTFPVLGGGYRTAEFDAYGVRREDRINAIEEVLELARKAETGAPFTYRGRRIERLTPTPDEPMRMLMGGSFPRTMRRAVNNGASGVSPNRDELFDVFREELVRLGRPDPGPYPVLAGHFIHVVDDVDQGWDEVGPHLIHWLDSYKKWTLEIGSGSVLPFGKSDVAALRDDDKYMVVTPQQLIEHMNGIERDTIYQFWPLMAGLAPELGWKSLELLKREVLPHVTVRQNLSPFY